ncbi:MAG: hypothetical protein JNM07_08225 [Phycisphaerae bacterium]|nr:hypothetical protein [Phycisphaerae bacterium]
MKHRRPTGGLLALNGGLLAALLIAVAWPSGDARGQGVGTSRPRGQYTILSGRVQGGAGNAAYVLDSVNAELIAVRWNRTSGRLEGLGYRSILEDARGVAAGAGVGGGR